MSTTDIINFSLQENINKQEKPTKPFVKKEIWKTKAGTVAKINILETQFSSFKIDYKKGNIFLTMQNLRDTVSDEQFTVNLNKINENKISIQIWDKKEIKIIFEKWDYNSFKKEVIENLNKNNYSYLWRILEEDFKKFYQNLYKKNTDLKDESSSYEEQIGFDEKNKEYIFNLNKFWHEVNIVFNLKWISFYFENWDINEINIKQENINSLEEFQLFIQNKIWKNNLMENIIDDYYKDIFNKVYKEKKIIENETNQGNKLNEEITKLKSKIIHLENLFKINAVSNFLHIWRKLNLNKNTLNEKSIIIEQLTRVLKLLALKWEFGTTKINFNINNDEYSEKLDWLLKIFQLKNNLISAINNDSAGILWPKTIKLISKKLKELLNNWKINKKEINELLTEWTILKPEDAEEAGKIMNERIDNHTDYIKSLPKLKKHYNLSVIWITPEISRFQYTKKRFWQIS